MPPSQEVEKALPQLVPVPGPTLEESLKECPLLKREDIDHLQDWLQKEPHLPPMLDEELVPFLHRADYSLEICKGSIDRFWTLRTAAPEVFANKDPTLEVNRSQLAFFHLALLPKRDPDGNPVMSMGLEPMDLANFNADRAASVCSSLMEVMTIRFPTSEGFVCVMDASNLCLGHLARSSVRLLHTLLTFIQQAVPVRMKAIHVINVHSVVEKTMMLLKPFLGRELQRLLHFHSGAMESFYEVAPKDILPREYGGTCGSTSDYHRESVENLLLHKDWVVGLATRSVDESRRPGRKGKVNVFGAAGSFKKLSID